MFFGRNKGPRMESIAQGRERMRMLRKGINPSEVEARSVGERQRKKRTVMQGCVFAVLAMAGIMYITPEGQNLPLEAGFLGRDMNALLFGAKPADITGIAGADFALTAVIRGLTLCLAAAFLPFMTLAWNRMRDNTRVNYYVTFMGVTVGLPFTYVFVSGFLGPLLLDIFEIFTL